MRPVRGGWRVQGKWCVMTCTLAELVVCTVTNRAMECNGVHTHRTRGMRIGHSHDIQR